MSTKPSVLLKSPKPYKKGTGYKTKKNYTQERSDIFQLKVLGCQKNVNGKQEKWDVVEEMEKFT